MHPPAQDPLPEHGPLSPEALLSNAEMAAVDRAAVATGLDFGRLMAAAGRAVAAAVPGGAPVAVLCGPGNNGGDGYVAARVLAARGHAVTVHADAPPPPDSVAGENARRWTGALRPLADVDPASAGVVIDALYGAGLSRPIEGAAADAVRRVNAGSAHVVAVDVPSGLDGDTGRAAGPVVQAHATVAFFRARPGHWLWPGRSLCGDLTIADIGLTPRHLAIAGQPRLWLNAPPLWASAGPRPSPAAHKYDRGHCLVVSGPELATGAARLSAAAALNAGAGAVTLAGDAAALRVHAAHVTAIMLREAGDVGALASLLGRGRFAAAVIGPAAGAGEATRGGVEALIAAGVPSVIDADALTSLVGRLDVLSSRGGGPELVLTPHAGEFARLFAAQLAEDAHFASLPDRLRMSKVEQTRAAARLSRSVVVFKGPDTVIADPDGRAAINTNAGPELATAGSGDVLAGLAAAHLAQGMPAFEAAASAVWLHGETGARFGVGLTADRLVRRIMPLARWLSSPSGARLRPAGPKQP